MKLHYIKLNLHILTFRDIIFTKGGDTVNKKEELGVSIKTHRMSRHITQAELAKRIGVSSSAIAMYETGKREPDLDLCESIADALNISMHDLLGYDPYARDPNIVLDYGMRPIPHNAIYPETVLMSSVMDKMPEEDRKEVLKLFKIAFKKYFKDIRLKEDEED